MRQPLRPAFAGFRIHAHVEGAVLAETEAAFGDIQLRRGHPEIEQHAIDLIDVQCTKRVGEVAKVRAIGSDGEAFPAPLLRGAAQSLESGESTVSRLWGRAPLGATRALGEAVYRFF